MQEQANNVFSKYIPKKLTKFEKLEIVKLRDIGIIALPLNYDDASNLLPDIDFIKNKINLNKSDASNGIYLKNSVDPENIIDLPAILCYFQEIILKAFDFDT